MMAVHSGTAYPYSTTYLVTQLSKGAPPPVAHTCRAFYTPSVWLALYNLLVATEFMVIVTPAGSESLGQWDAGRHHPGDGPRVSRHMRKEWKPCKPRGSVPSPLELGDPLAGNHRWSDEPEVEEA